MKKPEPALPRKLWIGTYEFPLHLVSPDDQHLGLGKTDPADEREGMTLTGEAVGGFGIWIANNIAMRKQLEIMLHEVTHAINWVYDIDDGSDEESIATAHGTAWSQFWLDNPRFERWLVYTLARIRRARRVDDPPTTESK